MTLNLFLISIIVSCLVILIVLLKGNLSLKKDILGLNKELKIQSLKLDYQKNQYSDSTDYFSSAEIIIMGMMQEINYALKNEKGNLSENILKIIFEKAKALFQPEKCILVKVDTKKNTCSHLHSYGYKRIDLDSLGFSLDADKSFVGWSAHTGRFISCDDAGQDSLLRHLIKTDPLKCHYTQPLKVDGKVQAILCLGQLSQPIEKDILMRLFSILSNIASVALYNASLTQELRELSVRDSLTGLYNHSYFQKWLEDSLGRLKEENSVLSLAMIDLDHFKNVNDTYGHQTGDIILKTVSNLLNNLQIPDYISARYGGEEFALAFINKDKNQIQLILEEVREKIAHSQFEADGKNIPVTISAGIAEVRFSKTKSINKTDLIKFADQALYTAKNKGRNMIITA